MPNTNTDLCNYALSKVGGGGDLGSFKITNYDDAVADKSDDAILCRLLLPPVRKEVLCRARWLEATKYAELTADITSIEKADWEYAFTLPTDYLGRCQQINEDYHRSTKPRYIVQYDKEIVQGILFTNEYSNSDDDAAYIKYIFDLTDVSKFSPLLYNAIATKLASALAAVKLADKGVRRLQLEQEFEQLVLPLAEGENAEQNGDDEDLGTYSAIDARIP